MQDSNSSVESVNVSAAMSLRYSTSSQVRASFRVPVPVKLRIRAPGTDLAHPSSRIPRPKPYAVASSLPRSNPFSRILSPYKLLAPYSIPMTALNSSARHVQLASLSKHPHSLEDYAPSKLACSEWGHPSNPTDRACTSVLDSIPVPQRQGRFPPFGPLPALPDPNAWE